MSIRRSFKVPPPPRAGVRCLERLAMIAYLDLLRDACFGYVQMLRIGSSAMRSVVQEMLPFLKHQLNSRLFGTMSTALRQEMVAEVLSGRRYPGRSYHNQYDRLFDENEPTHPSNDDDNRMRKALADAKNYGSKCNSVCCTGAFVVETMLAVLLNEDVRELKLNKKSGCFFNAANHCVRRYVTVQFPAVLTHYANSLSETSGLKIPQLERLVVTATDISSKSFVYRNNHLQVLTSYPETNHYLELPKKLNHNQHELGGVAEDLMRAINLTFLSTVKFPKLTELILGNEAVNTSWNVYSAPDGRPVCHELFEQIGQKCPNLKVLDLSGCIVLDPQVLLFLCFTNPFRDEQGLGRVHAIDDRLYDDIASSCNDPEHNLRNVMKISILASLAHQRLDQEPELVRMAITNSLVDSLQVLRLNIDSIHPKYEMVPFLLATMPYLKSVGYVDVVRGLKLMRDMSHVVDISASGLEEFEFVFGHNDPERMDCSWARPEIQPFVMNFPSRLKASRRSSQGARDTKTVLGDDVQLIAQSCPNLRRIRISLFGEYGFLDLDGDIWRPFERNLLKLEELKILAHLWSHVRCLVQALGARLTRLYMALNDGFSAAPGVPEIHVASEDKLPCLETVFRLCPNLENLTFSFSLRAVGVHDDALRPADGPSEPFASLRHLHVHTYMTKAAFQYLWARAINLETVRMGAVIKRDIYPRNHEVLLDPALSENEFDESDVARLFRLNRMDRLSKFNVDISLKNIATAKMFVENLSLDTKEIGMLRIKVGLESEDLEPEEHFVQLSEILGAMSEFSEFCKRRRLANEQQISFQWERYGYLESFPEGGPMQNLIDDFIT